MTCPSKEIERGVVLIKKAGWGVATYKMPLEGDLPGCVLHANVIVEEWNRLWMGARDETNNTADLSAIGER